MELFSFFNNAFENGTLIFKHKPIRFSLNPPGPFTPHPPDTPKPTNPPPRNRPIKTVYFDDDWNTDLSSDDEDFFRGLKDQSDPFYPDAEFTTAPTSPATPPAFDTPDRVYIDDPDYHIINIAQTQTQYPQRTDVYSITGMDVHQLAFYSPS